MAQSLSKALSQVSYLILFFKSTKELLSFIDAGNSQIDALILENQPDLGEFWTQLADREVLLPVVVLEGKLDSDLNQVNPPPGFDSISDYNPEAGAPPTLVYLPAAQVEQIARALHRSINRFLELSSGSMTSIEETQSEALTLTSPDLSPVPHQQALTQKLRERLGYLGVYYKRNPEVFFRNLSPEEKQEFMAKLRQDYQEIILCYFSKDAVQLNQLIDNFVNVAFFADISVSQIVETHMELIDEFSKQLRLEGRSEDILLDYRLTLIDIIAHLCEMYRRSIPRES